MKHKYVFYLYPNLYSEKGKFFFVEKVSDGKEIAKKNRKRYDYQKLYWGTGTSRQKMRNWNLKKNKEFFKIWKRRYKMNRTDTNKKTDTRIFRNTAATTKKINITPSNMRGGIRLWSYQKKNGKNLKLNIKNK